LADFVDLLSGMTYKLRTERGVQDADREEVMATYVVKVHDQVGQFRGTSTDGTRTVKFKTWGRKLFAGTWADFFRATLGRRSKGESPPVTVDISDPLHQPAYNPEPALDARMTIIALVAMQRREDMKKHVNLLLDHHEWEQEGLTQKQMAERLGIDHASLRQRISRARKLVLTQLGDGHGQG
jgi:DNA-directed RNA polymerase specialized sigma24 family protein